MAGLKLGGSVYDFRLEKMDGAVNGLRGGLMLITKPVMCVSVCIYIDLVFLFHIPFIHFLSKKLLSIRLLLIMIIIVTVLKCMEIVSSSRSEHL